MPAHAYREAGRSSNPEDWERQGHLMFNFLKRFGKAPKEQEQPDPYHPMSRLTNAGSLLSHHGAHLEAAFVFAQLAWAEPDHAPGWAALASELICVSGDRADLALLEVALSCAKRALAEDPADPLAQELLQGAPEHTPLTAAAVDACRPFTGDPRERVVQAGFTAPQITAAMDRMEAWEQRLQLVMWLGDLVQPDYLDLLIHAAERDSHRDVRMGAVKRLRYYAEDQKVQECLERIVASSARQEIEPYVSMTLGAIPEPWAADLRSRIHRD
jgi:hypothetical protein